jgi:hypothetical protein
MNLVFMCVFFMIEVIKENILICTAILVQIVKEVCDKRKKESSKCRHESIFDQRTRIV